MKQPDETQGRRSRRRPSSADVSHAVFDRTRKPIGICAIRSSR
jgi:hypothetical protein